MAINTSTAPARVVDLQIRGFDVVGGVDANAEPGTWSTIRTAVVPVCDVRAGRELRLTVETPGGRQDTSVAFQAADRGLTAIWSQRCDATAIFQALSTTGATIVEVRGDTATTSTPVRTDLVEDMVINDAASQTNGLRAVADGMPTVLQPPRTVTLRQSP